MPTQPSSFQQFARSLGRVHESVHGDGLGVLSRVITTCKQMLADRGCSNIQCPDDINKAIESGSVPTVRGIHANGKKTDVYIHVEDKVGIKFARSVIESYAAEEDVSIVVISLEGPTPFTRKECENKNMQFMLVKDVCVNKTRHQLVPKHVKVDRPPHGITVDNLPKIMDTDPIVQYYDFPKGTILKVERVFGGHEIVPYFRVVTAASS